ncbi:MAG: N-acetyltransferase, partial [Bacilli bacterium]
MKITKSNLTIRSATPEDAEILTSWWNDGKVMAHAGFPLGLNMTAEETLKHINDNETSISQRCIIEIDGERVGEMNFRIYEDRKA